MGAVRYIGRFAPSPTGPLHAGSLVAALGSWLDAKAHNGQWLVRIEDVDTPRCIPGMDQALLLQLAACGLDSDAPPLYQSARSAAYAQALDALVDAGKAYPCACTRKDIEDALAAQGRAKPRHGELVYPGTCRHGLRGHPTRAWRFQIGFSEQKSQEVPVEWSSNAIQTIANQVLHWSDRQLGPQQQDVESEVGDFILKRADGLWAYQLAVVVDDAAQGITHVVRGQDLADNTARQILLQRALGLPTPQYLHLPLVLATDGNKLSKQNGARALDLADPLAALRAAASHLGLRAGGSNVAGALAAWVQEWRQLQFQPAPPGAGTTP